MMKLYDEVIGQILALCAPYPCSALSPDKEAGWEDKGNNNMVLRGDMAYELGGSGLPGIGVTAVTASRELVPEDEILLYGRDLPQLQKDTPYARLAFARVREEDMGEGNALYNAVKKIENTRYHVNPEGFMIRVSTIQKREAVRVDRGALQRGLDFQKAGSLMLRSFRENPKIEAVKLLFIDLEDFPYEQLLSYAKRAGKITETIDHMMKNIVMDCDACSLQEVCDEVEGLRELHFSAGQR